MVKQNERLKKGIKNINRLVEGGDQKLLNGIGEVSPDLANYVLEFIFGDLYNREGLDLKTKQIITITALAVLGNARPQLEYHIKAGLNIGLSRKEIIDMNLIVTRNKLMKEYSPSESEKYMNPHSTPHFWG